MATRSVQLADRLGENDVWPFALFECADLADQIIEPATEASARHLFDGQALCPQAIRIDEILRLIIRDQPHALAALLIKLRQPSQHGGFASAQEPTEHHEANAFHTAPNANDAVSLAGRR